MSKSSAYEQAHS